MDLDNNFSLSCTCFNQLYAENAHFNCICANNFYEYYNPTSFTNIGYRISGPNIIFCVCYDAKVCELFDILCVGLALQNRSNIRIPFQSFDTYTRVSSTSGILSYLEYDGANKICMLSQTCENIYTLCRGCDACLLCEGFYSRWCSMKFYAIDPTFYFERS